MTLGERISVKRKEIGLSQEKLGELFGVSRQTVYKWEADMAIPELDKLKGMAELFNVSLDYLINGKEETKEQETVIKYRSSRLLTGITVVLSLVCIFLIFSFNELKNDYKNLRNSIDSMNAYVNNRVNSIVSSVENTLNNYSSLSADYSVSAAGYDNNSLMMKALYKPKTMSLNTQAVYHCKSKDETLSFEGILNDDGYFEADITCALSNYIEISIELIDGDVHKNEIIKVYYGLYNATFGEFDIVWPFKVAMDKDNILERDCRVLRHDTGDNEFGIEMSKIVDVKMKLYRDDELICEYDNSGIDLSSDEYVFKRPEGIKVDIDKYVYREVLSVTDEYDRVLIIEQSSDGIISVLD